jgi:hypothetical protein
MTKLFLGLLRVSQVIKKHHLVNLLSTLDTGSNWLLLHTHTRTMTLVIVLSTSCGENKKTLKEKKGGQLCFWCPHLAEQKKILIRETEHSVNICHMPSYCYCILLAINCLCIPSLFYTFLTITYTV